MKKIQIKSTAYTYLSNNRFPQEYINITTAIISQPDIFNNLPVEPSVLEDAGKLMLKLANKANLGSLNDRNKRDIQRNICERYLATLSSFVLQRASEEKTEQEQIRVIVLSKFTPWSLTRNRSLLADVKRVEGVKANWTGRNGEAIIQWKRIPGIIYYEVQTNLNPADEDGWRAASGTTRTKLFLNGLENSSQVWVRVIGKTYGGKSLVPSTAALVSIISLY